MNNDLETISEEKKDEIKQNIRFISKRYTAALSNTTLTKEKRDELTKIGQDVLSAAYAKYRKGKIKTGDFLKQTVDALIPYEQIQPIK